MPKQQRQRGIVGVYRLLDLLAVPLSHDVITSAQRSCGPTSFRSEKLARNGHSRAWSEIGLSSLWPGRLTPSLAIIILRGILEQEWARLVQRLTLRSHSKCFDCDGPRIFYLQTRSWIRLRTEAQVTSIYPMCIVTLSSLELNPRERCNYQDESWDNLTRPLEVRATRLQYGRLECSCLGDWHIF
jgi:hypothetical protein